MLKGKSLTGAKKSKYGVLVAIQKTDLLPGRNMQLSRKTEPHMSIYQQYATSSDLRETNCDIFSFITKCYMNNLENYQNKDIHIQILYIKNYKSIKESPRFHLSYPITKILSNAASKCLVITMSQQKKAVGPLIDNHRLPFDSGTTVVLFDNKQFRWSESIYHS